MPSPNAHVDAEVELRLVVPEAGKVPVAVDLGYGTHDPFAVTAAFRGDGGTIEWVFARDLLREGLRRPTGEGDVQVWPGEADGRAVLLVSLTSPEGHAVLEADADDVRGFLDRTHALVPPGAESRYVHLDAELAGILGRAA
ncbi:SsgA family sporulation/cell division regulator [Quadrisphaera sp. DSM 44207]|uniref:SsgA family sporulation/cell division regulator n=1 Tax=Quadrisphaera sp. DSM 44207 TaxID=1881057 RepID=UPI000880ABF8|nr:SsgA family sporulation/cell division regulator [Quadrisphaera sp. DSM 44207]SDQ48748.1 Streptomyces sporulation and cell division protein, SsgA [Quadrisphaera sp. DSM 44207]